MHAGGCHHTGMRRLSLISLLALSLSACAGPQTPSATPQLRAYVTVGRDTEWALQLEGRDGMSVTGALAQLRSPSNVIQNMRYDASEGRYLAETPTEAGRWTINLRSNSVGTRTLDVQITPLTTPPDLHDAEDGTGAQASALETLSASSPIRLSWDATPGAQHYLVDLYQLGTLVASLTVDATSVVLPANTLKGGSGAGLSTGVSVTAVRQDGDASFSDTEAVVSAQISGSGLGFQVGP